MPRSTPNKRRSTVLEERYKDPEAGYMHDRIHHDRLEFALATRWRREQTHDRLSDVIGEEPSLRDRWVAASVIQWLGTNMGWALLQSCIEECGWYLHTIRNGECSYDARTPENQLWMEIEVALKARDAKQMQFDLSEPH